MAARRPHILITVPWPEPCIARARESYEVDLGKGSDDDLIAAMTRYDALCPTISDRLPAAVIEAEGRTVGMLANYGAGADHIDLVAAAAAGVAVSNTPDVLTEATAETALLLMLMAARRAGEAERRLRRGGWQGWRPTGEIGQGLAGKTLGLVGFGRIAQATARLARGHGMVIVYHARRRVAAEIEASLDARFEPRLAMLLGEADVVSLHCPGGAATHHLIDAAAFARMKPAALLINTARGTVVDEAALAAALAAGHIAGAGLDVYEQEPRVHPGLLDSETAVLLPHIGSATVETRVAMGMRALDNLDAFFAGRAIPDRIA